MECITKSLLEEETLNRLSCQGHITLGGESELEPESSESGSSFLEGEQA